MSETLFSQLAELGEQLEGTTKRLELTKLLAEFIRTLAPPEIPPAVRLIIGQVFPEREGKALNLSGRAVMEVIDELTTPPPSVSSEISSQAVDGGEAVRMLFERARRTPPQAPPPALLEVFHTLEQIADAAGKGSRARKAALLRGLFERSTPIEAKYLTKVIAQEMRHGVNEGILLDGIAKAAGIKTKTVSRANQLWGDIGEVALAAMTGGKTALEQASIRVFRPIKPMLAQTAEDLAETFEAWPGRMALEYKLDGARVQLHVCRDQVRIYSRQLNEVTDSLPDVAAEIRDKLNVREAVLEGEAVAVDAQGRPLPFQHLMRRFQRKYDIAETIDQVPVQLYLFDALYVDGRSLIDAPNQERWQALQEAAGELKLVDRLIPATLHEAKQFAHAAHDQGHEGVMIKDLDSSYTPGVRGKSWLKLKHVISLDLVILAADWGYGRRHGWLSNYHLAARDDKTGEYLVVGETFKGLTDDEFQRVTQHLLSLETARKGATVFVEPRIVVEVLFNEIQASSQYRSGFALRFARISRFRDDKSPEQAESMQAIRDLYERQFRYKGKPA